MKIDEISKDESCLKLKELSALSRNTSDFIFSLDIGTRSVVGVILKLQENSITIIDVEIAEHLERSMLDGQIHDVSEVCKVITQVKDRLAERNGPLQEVSVAAAGRSLKTKRVHLEKSISGIALLTKDDVLSLELSAIQEAQKQLADDHAASDFHHYYCVGYSVVNYYLDRDIIGNLVDQRGQLAEVDIIATFLPRVVVDSLMTALNRADLQMKTLTLEPIAAIQVLIPPSMRKLNIALVDIGAGTSDIALTAEGTVTAYGMVPIAGDEITEALSQAYLMDFYEAEQVKRKLQAEQPVSFTDILGMEYTLEAAEIVQNIQTEVERLAGEISAKILELNGKPPQAVMLIGGGSLTPTLSQRLADRLQMPAARVAVRGTEAIKNLIGIDALKGPEFVTPIGIAVAAQSHPIKYLTVWLNGEEVRIFDLKKIQVGDVLLHAGLDIKKLRGRVGMAITVQVNGKVKFIPGTLGTLPTITVNHQPAHFDTIISNHDKIQIEPGTDGEDAHVLVQDLIEEIGTLDVYIHDILYSLPPQFLRNGQPCKMSEQVKDRDHIQIRLPQTLEAVISSAKQEALLELTKINYTLNHQHKTIVLDQLELFINGKEAQLSSVINQGDHIKIHKTTKEKPPIQSLVPDEQQVAIFITVTFNGEPLQLPVVQTDFRVNGQPVTAEQRIEDGDELVIQTSTQSNPIYSDIFRYSPIEAAKPSGASKMKTLVNGKPVDFSKELKEGDRVELIWE